MASLAEKRMDDAEDAPALNRWKPPKDAGGSGRVGSRFAGAEKKADDH